MNSHGRGGGHRRGGSGRGGRPHAGSGPGARAPQSRVPALHPTEVPPDIGTFSEWELGVDVQRAIAEMGITVPTPIQKLAIGPVLAGKDVIAKAETGTGKTLAFGAPMMSKIDPSRASVLGLVLTPTRELAEQVSSVLQALGKPRNIRVALIVGGEPLGPQVKALQSGAQVVVGTPGRVLDLYGQRFLSLPWTEYVVLDEADRMLEIGFIDDVKKILSYAPEERQTLLFSATFPPELLKLARESTRDPVEVATSVGVKTVDSIDQCWMPVSEEDRSLALIRLFEQSDPDDVFLVFCDRREDVDRLMRRLERMPFSIKALHGGYDQEARFRVMSAFRTGDVKALVATDVASRGLDVVHVTHVVNYGPPRDVTDYTHRIGRTGRAGRSGRAITFVTPLGMRRWKDVLRQATWNIEEVPPPGPSRRRDGPPRPRTPREPPPVAAPDPAPPPPADTRSATPYGPGTSRSRGRPGRTR
ncbi:MAG TPA: DEAD/DEAH box helicase [Planctomycetota bacterium]|jgi:ATP-dependent RNA helicase DeaD|nr:DEAD/DEAH box helicase [Planctomycetota bacterium]